MKYKVITKTDDKYGFQEMVTKHVEDGWRLQGGVSITKDRYGDY